MQLLQESFLSPNDYKICAKVIIFYNFTVLLLLLLLFFFKSQLQRNHSLSALISISNVARFQSTGIFTCSYPFEA